MTTPFSSCEARSGSLSVWVKTTHVAGGSAPDAPLSCVLSKVYSKIGLGIALAVSCCVTFGATPLGVTSATPGEAAWVTPDEIQVVDPDDVDDTPASCRSGLPASDDEFPGPGDDALAPGEDAAAPVNDARPSLMICPPLASCSRPAGDCLGVRHAGVA